MNRSQTAILLLLVANLATAATSMANGVSLYQRIAVEESGKLSFLVADHDDLPQSQRVLLACNPVRNPPCVSQVLEALERELLSQDTPNMKAWKHFLIGTVHFQRRAFNDALVWYESAIEQADDQAFRAAIVHRTIDIHLILHDPESALATLQELRVQFPDYNRYNMALSTYPNSLCDHAWFTCQEPTAVKKLMASVAVFESTAKNQRKLTTISTNSSHDEHDDYVQTALDLATSYEKVCPKGTIYDRVCPDALEMYKEIYDRFPTRRGADYAFLRLQYSKFAYEYEVEASEVIRESQHIVELYTPFVEQYPNSSYADSIRGLIDQAKKTLQAQAQ